VLFKYFDDRVNEYFRKRIYHYYIILVFCFSIIAFTLIYLQIIRYSFYKDISENNRIRIVNIKAERGLILDRNNVPIVMNAPGYNLYVVKEDAKDIKKLIQNLQKILPDMNIDKAFARIKKTYIYEPALIYRGLDLKKISFLMEHIDEYKGIKIDTDTNRKYLDGRAFSHVIGYMGEANEEDIKKRGYKLGEQLGKSGIENKYEQLLKGINGAMQVEVNNYGQINKILMEKPSVRGDDLILTLDANLQIFVSHLYDGKKGAAIVLDIYGNEPLALFSAPTYDLNEFIPFININKWKELIADKKKPLTNRCIEGLYSPGSTFKIIMAYAALTSQKISPKRKFYCKGEYYFGPLKFHCWQKYGHGYIDLKNALIQSCDIYFYNLGQVLGIDVISMYAKSLGLGEKTGIDLQNEKSGIFPSKDWKRKYLKLPWYPGETIITSIGQGYISITPLQMAVALSAIFNGGKTYEPKIAKAYKHANSVNDFNRVVKRELIINDNIKKFILEAMDGVVNSDFGTGYRARVKGFKIGGKTGTAQVVKLDKTKDLKEDEIPEEYRDHSWFVSVFPIENPRFVSVVLVENGGAGGRSAASIAGAIANKMQDLGYVEKTQE
jgi:penicillin-binding protein 2